jgi:hypothetical protein
LKAAWHLRATRPRPASSLDWHSSLNGLSSTLVRILLFSYDIWSVLSTWRLWIWAHSDHLAASAHI